jgi:hypothetical protein
MVTQEQIEVAKTPNGAWTRKQLAEWGVGWPPKKGWKKRITEHETRPIQYREKTMAKPAWNYVCSTESADAELDRRAMKALYQEKSGDYSY